MSIYFYNATLETIVDSVITFVKHNDGALRVDFPALAFGANFPSVKFSIKNSDNDDIELVLTYLEKGQREKEVILYKGPHPSLGY
jgi:hypothetical protein